MQFLLAGVVGLAPGSQTNGITANDVHICSFHKLLKGAEHASHIWMHAYGASRRSCPLLEGVQIPVHVHAHGRSSVRPERL